MAILCPPLTTSLAAYGLDLANKKIFFYIAGTSTKQDAYTSQDESTPLANPATFDANGELEVWLGSNKKYKIVIASATATDPPTGGDILREVDNIEGFLQFTVSSVSGNTSVTSNDANVVFLVDATAGNVTVTPPALGDVSNGFTFHVKKIDSSSNYVEINPPGATNVDHAAYFRIATQDQSATFVKDTSQWYTLNLQMQTELRDTNNNVVLNSSALASPVNYLQAVHSATGSPVGIQALGTDTNIGYNTITKGTGAWTLKNAAGLIAWLANSVASAVNYLTSTNSSTGNPVKLTATGTDTNIDVRIEAKGSGRVKDKDGALLGNPVGTIIMYGSTTAPTGYLECDASAVSRTTYADLFAVISTTFGVGDGSTTFNLPDLRGRCPIGRGTGSGLTARTIAAKTGAETVALSAGEMPSHTHTITNNITAITPGTGSFGSSAGALDMATGTSTTSSAGSGTAHNNMQPSLVVAYFIKY